MLVGVGVPRRIIRTRPRPQLHLITPLRQQGNQRPSPLSTDPDVRTHSPTSQLQVTHITPPRHLRPIGRTKLQIRPNSRKVQSLFLQRSRSNASHISQLPSPTRRYQEGPRMLPPRTRVYHTIRHQLTLSRTNKRIRTHIPIRMPLLNNRSPTSRSKRFRMIPMTNPRSITRPPPAQRHKTLSARHRTTARSDATRRQSLLTTRSLRMTNRQF